MFLGLELNYTRGGIHVHQRMKIEKAEAVVDLEKRSVNVPLQENLKLENASGKPLEDLRPFQSVLGSLLHIALGTRPDICFAVHAMSRRTSCATTTDLKLVRRVMKYLVDTKNLSLCFKTISEDALKLEMEVDASFAMGPKKKSVYGYLIKVNNAPILYRSKLEPLTAMSSTEAEYIGIAEATKPLRYIANVLEFLGLKYTKPINVYNDNMGAILIGSSKGSLDRTKHIELKFHVVQELINMGKINLSYKNTNELQADMFTKALGFSKLKIHRNALMKTCAKKNSTEEEEDVVVASE
eukprot:snap_masked-scaffold_14-processed-gene-10.54-mRNA-1 protein AED:0.29 eAED:0.29 QI:0/-1/0/1/-1/1/1/0/296